MKKILNTIGDTYTDEAKKILSSVGEADYKILTQDELLNIIEDYDVAVIGLGLNFDKLVLDKAKKLKAVATATTGLDHIDTEHAKEKGIEVISLRGQTEFLDTITGTAELAFGIIINLFRRIHPAFDHVKGGGWNREAFIGHNMSKRTMGVVGAGRLGRMMIRYGNSFGMNVIFSDPNVEEKDVDGGAKKVSFEYLIRESDVITIHVHLHKETENLFHKDIFKSMKNSAYLVNTSRGEIVNEKDLLRALQNDEIGGYGADVLTGELAFRKIVPDNHPLVAHSKKCDNCIIVPHIGGMTHESRASTDIFIAEKVKSFLAL